ncbi:MAG: hypothetical protein F6K17_16740 [Okeania sp. SIO3C4]|nr:hypothetical protein [Okeania sp. SIO3C4]
MSVSHQELSGKAEGRRQEAEGRRQKAEGRRQKGILTANTAVPLRGSKLQPNLHF